MNLHTKKYADVLSGKQHKHQLFSLEKCNNHRVEDVTQVHGFAFSIFLRGFPRRNILIENLSRVKDIGCGGGYRKISTVDSESSIHWFFYQW